MFSIAGVFGVAHLRIGVYLLLGYLILQNAVFALGCFLSLLVDQVPPEFSEEIGIVLANQFQPSAFRTLSWRIRCHRVWIKGLGCKKKLYVHQNMSFVHFLFETYLFPQAVSTLRGSYGKCKKPGFHLGPGLFTVNSRAKVPF